MNFTLNINTFNINNTVNLNKNRSMQLKIVLQKIYVLTIKLPTVLISNVKRRYIKVYIYSNAPI